MPKKVSRMLQVEYCKEMIAARQQLTSSSAIISAVLNLVGKKWLLPAKEVLSMKEQEELRVNINGLLESMKELESATSVVKKGISTPQLPNEEGDDTFQPAVALKRTIFSRYMNASFEHSQMQRSCFVTSFRRLTRRNTSLNLKIMRTEDFDLTKQDSDTVGQTFEPLEKTTWISAKNLSEQQHSYGDDILESDMDNLLTVYMCIFCLDENTRLQTASETCE